MDVEKYPEWPEVDPKEFEEGYLKDCPDYKADGFGRLVYRHNDEVFAVIFGTPNRVRVNPKILAR